MKEVNWDYPIWGTPEPQNICVDRIEGGNDNSNIIFGDFNTPLSIMGKPLDNKEMKGWATL